VLEPELWLQEDDGGDFGAAVTPFSVGAFKCLDDWSVFFKEVAVAEADRLGELNSGKLV